MASSSFHTPQADPVTPAPGQRSGPSGYFDPQRATSSKSVRWGDQSSAVPSSQSMVGSTQTLRSSQQPAPQQQLVNRPSGALSTPSKPSSNVAASTAPSSSQAASKSASTSAASPSSPAKQSTPATTAQHNAISRSALRARVKWNSGALVALLLLPRFSSSKRLYWSFLDAVHSTFGGSSDEAVDASLAWISWAVFILFLVNLIEAGTRLALYSEASSMPSKKPLLSQPPGSVDVPISPAPSPSSTHSNRSPVRYSSHSPLKSSLEAASRSARKSSAQSSPLNPGSSSPSSSSMDQGSFPRRLPSGPPSIGASPLAAYLARRGVSGGAGGSSGRFDPDSSISSDTLADISSDSFEVDRALRALSGNFARVSSGQYQQSQSGSSTAPAATPSVTPMRG